MALTGHMNVLGTLSSSLSGIPTATSWREWLGKRAGFSLQDPIFSCYLKKWGTSVQHAGKNRLVSIFHCLIREGFWRRMLGQQTGTGLVTNIERFASSRCHSPSVVIEAASMSSACSLVAYREQVSAWFSGNRWAQHPAIKINGILAGSLSTRLHAFRIISTK